MVAVNDIVLNFQKFLVAVWDSVESFNEQFLMEEKQEKLNDWLQANWELLVESSACGINEYLEVYGYGADCNGASSRVTFPDKPATHRVVCNAYFSNPIRDLLTGELISIANMQLECFASWNGAYYEMSPPFDHVLVSNDRRDRLLAVADVNFDIEAIAKG